MAGLLNLLTIITGLALAIWLAIFPEKKFLKGRSVWQLAVWEFRIEFPYQLWLLPTIAVLQLVFVFGTLFLFTTLFGKYFAGAEPVLPSQFVIAMLPIFVVAIGFPVGVVEMLKGMSINMFGRVGGNRKNIAIADEFKKVGLFRVLNYIGVILLMFVVSFIFRRIYG